MEPPEYDKKSGPPAKAPKKAGKNTSKKATFKRTNRVSKQATPAK
jgi:hypothetical protein